MKPLFTIGADPELFAQDHNHIARSVIGKIGGNKENPNFWDRGFALQEDNVSVEFNIPPCVTSNGFVTAIQKSLERVQYVLSEHGLFINTKCAINFQDTELATPEAWIFGCEPDYNVYTEDKNDKPQCDLPNLRTAGGHIHIGTKTDPINLVKTLDFLLGVPSVLLDKDTDRKMLYGKAGAFRPTSYGVEYRVLSNFWIFDEKLIKFVYDQVALAHRLIKRDSIIPILNRNKTAIINTINKNNIDLAESFVRTYEDWFILPNMSNDTF